MHTGVGHEALVDSTTRDHDTRQPMAPKLSSRDYFDVILPTILRWKGPAAAAIGVNVRFVVTGRGGGTWTVRLRPPAAGVVAGSDWKADLVVKITTEELGNILGGTFDAGRAIAAGNIELQGDLTVLRRVGFLFQSGGSQAEVRTESATAGEE